MGFDGNISTIAASPVLMDLGLASLVLPVRLSMEASRLLNLHAMWEV